MWFKFQFFLNPFIKRDTFISFYNISTIIILWFQVFKQEKASRSELQDASPSPTRRLCLSALQWASIPWSPLLLHCFMVSPVIHIQHAQSQQTYRTFKLIPRFSSFFCRLTSAIMSCVETEEACFWQREHCSNFILKDWAKLNKPFDGTLTDSLLCLLYRF